MKPRMFMIAASLCLLLAALPSCQDVPEPAHTPAIARETRIPPGAVKMSPGSDPNPPQVYSDEYGPPVPVPGQVNSAGAEDSAFVTSDGGSLYFFFTPDVEVPVEQQILDGVTGLYVSRKTAGGWGRPERIILQEPGRLALDGCEFVQGKVMWFCSAREGYPGIHWFTADYQDGKWQNWKDAGFPAEYQVGELHISPTGRALYFGSALPGGQGGLDIWVSEWIDGAWQAPTNLAAVNTPADEGWPALNPAGDELWITRNWGVWRSKRVNEEWQAAELIVSPLAGEASLDDEGNLYFVHHYYVDGKMIEADLYVAYKK